MIDEDDGIGRGRRNGWWGWLAAAVLLAGIAALPAYAYLVEPRRIEVTHHALVGKVTHPLRIAHLTDLHSHDFGAREQKLVFLVRQEHPDLIVITGDLLDRKTLDRARDFLVNLSAPLGVWVVRGEADRWKLPDTDRAFYASSGVRFLDNMGMRTRDDLWIAGLTDPSHTPPDISRALSGAPPDAFKLVLLHAPDYFHEIGGRFDLALAGHTHGGQVVVPGYGPLWSPVGGSRYLSGWYTQNGSALFVSRGLGTSHTPARFHAIPELAIIDVRPE